MVFPVAGIIMGGIQAATGVAKLIGGKKAKKKAEKQAEQARREMRARQREYEQLDMSNPYADYQNQMAENVYEDLTVNTQAAEFAAEQNQQGLANTLSNMNQAAGGSGIAALAQALAGQSAIANQKASISIAEQERQNEMKERAQADQLDTLERKGNKYVEDMRRNMAREALGYTMADIAGNNAEIREAGEQTRQAIEDAGTSFASTTEALGNL